MENDNPETPAEDESWKKKTLGYIGKKLDKALDEWLGLAVIVLALAVAAWFGVLDEFATWLDNNSN